MLDLGQAALVALALGARQRRHLGLALRVLDELGEFSDFAADALQLADTLHRRRELGALLGEPHELLVLDPPARRERRFECRVACQQLLDPGLGDHVEASSSAALKPSR